MLHKSQAKSVEKINEEKLCWNIYTKVFVFAVSTFSLFRSKKAQDNMKRREIL